jgi:hypothetical protein
MSALTKSLSLLVVVAACVMAMALPSAASATTGDGGGGAPFTLYTNNFTAYGCTYYATNQHITYYNCTGGIRSGGYFYSGTKCARYNYGWGWYGSGCRNYV